MTDFGAKGTKRSVKLWTTNFYIWFFKNIFFYLQCRLSKICSVHTYVTVYTGRLILVESVHKQPKIAHYIRCCQCHLQKFARGSGFSDLQVGDLKISSSYLWKNSTSIHFSDMIPNNRHISSLFLKISTTQPQPGPLDGL